MAKSERGDFSLIAHAAAHDQVAEVHHFAVHSVFPGQVLGDLVRPFKPVGTVGRFDVEVGRSGEAVRESGV